MKAMRILFWFYLILLPLMNLPRPFPLGTKVQYADIAFIFLFISWCVCFARSKNFALPPKQIIILLGLLILASLFSCFYSIEFSKSFVDFLGLVYLVILFLVFSSVSKEKGFFGRTMNIIFFTSVLTSAIGIVSLVFSKIGNQPWAQQFLFPWSELKASVVFFPRIKSSLALPEMFITFSQLGLVCGMISLEFQDKHPRRKIWILGILTIVLAAIFAYSRSLVGFFLTLSVMVLLKKNFRFRIPLRIAVVLLFLVLFVSSIITSIWVVYPITLEKDADTEMVHIKFYGSPDIRATLRNAAFAMALKNPLWGIGQGMFTYRVKEYITPNVLKNTIYKDNLSLEIDPHCAYAGSMAETGFLGLGIMLLFFYFLIKAAIGFLKKSLPSPYRNAEVYLLASFIGYLLTACFMDVFTLRHFWITAALLHSVPAIGKNYGE